MADTKIIEAADWYSGADPKPRPAVPELRRRFGLTANEACEVVRLAMNARSVK
ncbi:hypothetical protein [Acuticoccus sp. I52.16.1]|uniref:hypothetical protein n=1 Tax=Acuticoccus sp. I52.16.1 TaxID=2928472 RepID=UPI001FCFA0C3|nr:hypothetical protein [Acuticoccus sp. I52.16.1]UOM34867.1 hypothetical protein MRB58_01250 [Acuticoccus sp. I52.16.1]